MAPPPPPPSLLDLPDDLLTQVVALMFEDDVATLWALSRVCRGLKTHAEAAASRRRRLGGDASSACLRKRTTLAEPALPLKRLLSCMPSLVTLDLSGAYWWVRGGGGMAAAEAIATAPFAPVLEVLRLDHCEELTDAALTRLLTGDSTEPPMARINLQRAMMRAAAEAGGGGGLPDADADAEGDADTDADADAEDEDELTYMGTPPTFPRLRELSLRSCRKLSDPAFLYWTPRLQRLDLAWCAALRGLSRLMLAYATPRLVSLDATGIEDTDLAPSLPRGVRELGLAMTPLSDDGLAFLAVALPELRRLVLSKRADNLWADGRHTDAGVAEFRRRRPGVEVVFVSA